MNDTFLLFSKYASKENITLDEWLDKYRRPDRYKLRDGPAWGVKYSKLIRESHEGDILQFGITWISPHESNTGHTVSFIPHPINL